MEIAPMVNQMETHVFNQQHETRIFMDEIGTKLMAWAPLAEGQNGMFTNPTLTQIGEKYGKTAAQVALRWLLQRCDHHPEDRSQGAHGRKSESLRLRT